MTAATQIVPTSAFGLPANPEPYFTDAQEKMILRTFLGGASKEEAAVLLETVRRRRLDPFSRQVYFIKRWDAAKREEVWAIQTSIDGLRAIAERTGKYDGQDEPVYGEDDGGRFCKVKVYRKDWSPTRYAMGIAYEKEFIQKKKDGTVTSFWQRMPRLMLAKCAEALAIRKAFPEDTGGLYIAEEMGQDPQPEVKAVDVTPPAAELPAPAEEPAEVAEHRGDAFDLWDRLEKDRPQTAGAEWQKAATAVFGGRFPPAKNWTSEQTESVARILFPPANP